MTNGSSSVPKIAIDARMVFERPHGFSRYVCRMAQALGFLKSRGTLHFHPVFLTNESHRGEDFFGFETYRVRAPFLSLRELIEIPRALKKISPAFYHSPTFSSLLYSPCPTLITVHDLNHLQFGNWKQKFYYEFLLRRFIQKSKLLLTDSQFSRTELAQWLDMSEDEIRILDQALEDRFQTTVSDSELMKVLSHFNLRQGDYFFCLSNAKPHKNLAALVAGFDIYRQQKAPFLPLIMNVPAFSDAHGVQFVEKLTDLEAHALFQGARACFFPSLYEGFGLPPVEAAVCGAPIVVSRIPPHVESLGALSPEEIRWVEPKNIQGWARAFHEATQGQLKAPSPESRAKLLDRFSLARMGESLDRIYDYMLKIGET